MNSNDNIPVLPLILAAGFGTRLGELTKNTPKPLLRIGQWRMIEFPLWQLKKAGFQQVRVNLHYHGEQIAQFLGDGSRYGLKIEYARETTLLETGGPIFSAMQDHPGHDVLVINSDVVFGTTLNIPNFVTRFQQRRSVTSAQLLVIDPAAVPEKITPIVVGTRPNHAEQTLVGIYKSSRPDIAEFENIKPMIFACLHILRKDCAQYMLGLPTVFSSTRDLYPTMLEKSVQIDTELFSGTWFDAGSAQKITQVEQALLSGKIECGF
jgi:NDP-sugar pyrophosphorylase family protein